MAKKNRLKIQKRLDLLKQLAVQKQRVAKLQRNLDLLGTVNALKRHEVEQIEKELAEARKIVSDAELLESSEEKKTE